MTQKQNIMKKAGITLRLGAIVVDFSKNHCGKNNYANDISYRLKTSINRHRLFSPSQKKHLQTYLLYKLKTPENRILVSNEIAALSESKKRNVRHILVKIAFSDKKITHSKKECISKLYAALGFNEAMLIDDINREGLSLSALKETFLDTENIVKVDFSPQAKERRHRALEIQTLKKALSLLSKAINTPINKKKTKNTNNDVIQLVNYKK